MGDISSLLLARAIATYAPEGVVALLLPEGILLNEPGGRAIRRCTLKDIGGTVVQRFSPIHVDDFTSLKPFPDAANKTIGLYVQAGQDPSFPFPQTTWTRSVPGASISSAASLRSVATHLSTSEEELAPTDPTDRGSRWRTVAATGREIGSRVENGYTWGQGFHTRGADGLFYCDIVSSQPLLDGLVRIRTRPDLGRNTRDIPQRELVVESKFLWPLLRGADINYFDALKPTHYCIVPHDPERLQDILTVDEMLRVGPHLFDYLELHKDRLRNRSAYDLKLSDDQPWGIQGQAWRHMSRSVTFVAARYMVSNKMPPAAVISPQLDTRLGFSTPRYPNNKVNFVTCAGLAEADYVAACINAPLVQEEIARLVSSTAIGPSVMSNLPIPRFSGASDAHNELRRLGQECRIDPHGWEALRGEADGLVRALWRKE